MRRRLIEFLGVCLLVASGSPMAMSASSPRATSQMPPGVDQTLCTGWNWIKVQSQQKTEIGWTWAGVRAGYAQGVATGLAAEPLGSFTALMDTHTYPDERRSDPYMKGLLKEFDNPGVLVDAFDSKCADYRNGSIRLDDLATVVLAELGGLQEARVEEALRVLRAGGRTARGAMLTVLQGK